MSNGKKQARIYIDSDVFAILIKDEACLIAKYEFKYYDGEIGTILFNSNLKQLDNPLEWHSFTSWVKDVLFEFDIYFSPEQTYILSKMIKHDTDETFNFPKKEIESNLEK
jgi:hypothetical protein